LEGIWKEAAVAYQETILAFAWMDWKSYEKPQLVSWLSLELSTS
jgi:hypothetical protein